MIHPTAIIDSTAALAADVEVGPYAIIGKKVTIGSGTTVGAHAVIGDWTEIGENNRIFPQSSVGAPPQDLKYRNEECWTRLGNGNMVREFATIHRGTVTGHGETVVGSNNLFMAYSHVAHDCIVGSGVVMANVATLAGHVTVEDNVIVGGLVAVHQFSRIGAYAMIGGGTMVGMDILPYTIATPGKRDAKHRGLNLIGLKRRGFSDDTISKLKTAYKTIFMAKLKLPDAVARIKSEISGCPEIDYLLAFIDSSQRGLCQG
ncbi:MAG TPA: acyl-ACP--UDP-N-acetylglucosamine O-acyltransferase [Desulfuromonadales bacterium]|nr:acyl-ACP--UDP-N-acetylglucosamine O-acyltransferase [Desulfuromonadales bacterium]